MARKLRLEYPGAIYHVMSRGDRSEPIFLSDSDRELFLAALGEACDKTGWQIHAYCLMENHFHLVMETPNADLVSGMKWLLGTYTSRFNRRHKQFGHLFGGRYKSLIVDRQGGYLKTVCDYVHLNPTRARLLNVGLPLSAYRWSSYPDYLIGPSRRPAWLRVGRLFGESAIPQDSMAGRSHFEELMENRHRAEQAGDGEAPWQGWCLGGEQFRKELLVQMSQCVGKGHLGRDRQESNKEKADRIVGEEMIRRGWSQNELFERRKGDAEKVKIALRLRTETSVTLKWIAERLQMGSWTYVSNLLCQK